MNAVATAAEALAPYAERPEMVKKSNVPTYPGELGIRVDREPVAMANHGPKGVPS
jgi:hypothetical protein